MAWADDVRRGNEALDRGAASVKGPVPMGIARKLRENRAEYSNMYQQANPNQMTPVGPSQIRKLADAAHIADSNRDAGHLVNMDWMRNMYGEGVARTVASRVNSGSMVNGGAYSSLAFDKRAQTPDAGTTTTSAEPAPMVDQPAYKPRNPVAKNANGLTKVFGTRGNYGDSSFNGGLPEIQLGGGSLLDSGSSLSWD